MINAQATITLQVCCRFQDGASTANNPAALAIQEARSLWPESSIDCLVSIGSGNIPLTKREKNTVSSYLDIGSVLIESACDVSRVDAILSTLLPMVPDVKYFRWVDVPTQHTTSSSEQILVYKPSNIAAAQP